MGKPRILVAGAGINGLVAANYLQRAGCRVTMIERADRVGGACVSELAEVNGVKQHYALGDSVLGLMQGFGFERRGVRSGDAEGAGLGCRLRTRGANLFRPQSCR